MKTLVNTTPGAGQPSIGDIFGMPKENASNVVSVEGANEIEINKRHSTFTIQPGQALSDGTLSPQVWQWFIQVFGPAAVLGGVNDASVPPTGNDLCNDVAAAQAKGETLHLNKTPSGINAAGFKHRISGWTKPLTEEQLKTRIADQARWMNDPRVNVLLHCADLRGVDVDVPNQQISDKLVEIVKQHLGDVPLRRRVGTGKVTAFVRVQGNRYMPKRVVKKNTVGDVAGWGAIEFLGQKQQSVVSGIHDSGSAYYWEGMQWGRGIEAFPMVTEEQMKALYATLAALPDVTAGELVFGDEAPSVERGAVERDDPVLEALYDEGLVLQEDGNKVHIKCPFAEHHTDGGKSDGPTSTTYFLAEKDEQGTYKTYANFACLHSCQGIRKNSDYLKKIGYTGPRTHVGGCPTEADLSAFGGVPRPEGDVPPIATPVSPKRYTLQSADEFLSKPPISWYLRHILPRNGVEVIYGPSRAGKTFIVLDLVMSLLDHSRDEWFGNDIRNRPSGVVYLAMEGAYGVRGRVKAWANDNNGLPQNMRFLEGQAFNMLQAADVDALTATVVEHFPQNAIVVIDTQAKAAAGADEQAAKDMGLVYLAAERIAQATGGLVMLVAHTGKDIDKGIRGSSAQTGAADGMILVTRTNDNPDANKADDSDDGENEVRTWKVVKCKDGPENATGAFKLESIVIGRDADGEDVTSAVVRETAMPRGKKRKTMGKNTRMVFDTLLELVKQTGSPQIPETLWRDAVIAKIPNNSKRYQVFARDGVRKLVETGYVDKVSDTHYAVSLGVGIGLTEEQLPSAISFSTGSVS